MISGPVLFRRFTGREAELDQLLELWRRASRENDGNAIAVAGEAGVGKSRLLAEFRAAVMRERGIVATTRCDESVQFAYAPIIDLIDGLLKNRIARDSLDLAGARRRLTDPLPTSSGPHASALAQRYTSVVDALSDIAARGNGLALLIDDLQWSDASSLDLLRYLAREVTAAPLMLVLAYRREDTADANFAAALAKIERERVYRMGLVPLGDAQIRSAIADTVGDPPLPEKAIARISELAEGKPYFAEELLRSALEDAGSMRDIAAPTSLRAAVLGRVDALAPQDRNMLANAAVIGRTFSATLLARLLDADLGDVFRALRAARNAQIVRESDNSDYEFRHALTREILYSEFLVAEARMLHVRIADSLETEAPRASLLAEVAYHRWLGRDGERSALANQAAGDDAARLSAFNDAVKFYERALETADPKSARAAMLAEKIARAAIMIGDVERARERTARSIAGLRALGDVRNARRLTLWSARQSELRGEHAAALDIIASVTAEVASDPGDEANHIAAEIAYALLVGREGAAEALATTDRLLASGKTIGNDDAFHLYHARGTAHVGLGRYIDAIDDFERAEKLAAELDDTYGALYSANNRAAAAGYSGRFDIARSAYESALERANTTGIENTISLLAANAAFWQLLLGDLERARSSASAALTRRASDHAVVLATSVSLRIATLEGRSERNGENGRQNLERALVLKNSTLVGTAAGALALARLSEGNEEPARRAIEAGLAQCEEFDPTVFWLIEAAARAGDAAARERARALLASAEGGSAAANGGYRALFEALVLAVGGGLETTALARTARDAFVSTGLAYETALACALAGDRERAVRLFREMGAEGEVRRMQGSPERVEARATEVTLTRREEQIARLAARGLSNKAIATELRIGERTVESHIAHAYEKLRVRTRAELALHFADEV